MNLRKTITLTALVALTLGAVPAPAVSPDRIGPVGEDAGLLAKEVLAKWADFKVPVDAENNTPWGYVDLPGWVRSATREELIAARDAATFDGVVAAFGRLRTTGSAAKFLPAGVPLTPAAIGNTAGSLVFTPVSPCRIIDTRAGTSPAKITSAGAYFYVTGTDYSAQGGVAASCGIPSNPKPAAVALNVTSTGQTTAGYIKIIPYGAGNPLISLLNYYPGTNLANAAVLANYQGPSPEIWIASMPGSTTDVVIDISGYFTTPGPSQYVANEGSGALTLATSQFVCKTTNFTPTQAWTAIPMGSVSLQADGTGTLGFGADSVYSTDSWATWSYVPGSNGIMRGSATAGTWGATTTNWLGQMTLTAGTTYSFGIIVSRQTGSGNAIESRCSLRVRLE